MEREFAKAVDDFSRDPACLAGILTGTGAAFCGEWTEPEPFLADAQQGFSRFSALYPFSNNVDKPVIAAINGLAIGRGFELAIDCDIRIAAKGAKLAVGPAGGDRRLIYTAQVLPRLVPFGEAMRLLLSEDAIDADEAHRIGLVQRVVSGDRLLAEATAMARTMAQWGLPGLTATKRIGLYWRNLMMGQSYEMARAIMGAMPAKKGL
jgi:enoyl-CoA hydratase/carnithine racemase